MEYDDELQGVLFTNDQEGNDKRPNYKGKIQIDGVKYELAGWIREANGSGKKFLSLKASLPNDDWKKDRADYTPTEPSADETTPF